MIIKSLALTLLVGASTMKSTDILEIISTCPSSPNCVSTMAKTDEHKISAWDYRSDSAAALEAIKSIALSEPRTQLVSESDNSLHFVFTSLIFRFKDDVWFYLDDQTKKIHFKSASRTGHSDLGANRKRMNLLFSKYQK